MVAMYKDRVITFDFDPNDKTTTHHLDFDSHYLIEVVNIDGIPVAAGRAINGWGANVKINPNDVKFDKGVTNE